MNSASLNEQLRSVAKVLIRFRIIIFIVMLALIYAFLFWRIAVLKNASPSQADIAAQSSAATNIDPATVNKITELQNNSVNVQALFNQARQNPFAE